MYEHAEGAGVAWQARRKVRGVRWRGRGGGAGDVWRRSRAAEILGAWCGAQLRCWCPAGGAGAAT